MAGTLRLWCVAASAAIFGLVACAPPVGDDSSGNGGKGTSAATAAGGSTGSNGVGGSGGDLASSTGSFLSTADSSTSTGCQGQVTCESQGLNCGTIGDGCGNTLDCGGACADPDETCGGSGTPNVCGAPPCKAKTCGDLGFDCGPAGDGCGKQIDCGDTCPIQGDTCGGGGTGKCGHTSVCTAKSCADQGIGCGPAGDGCGNGIDCGGCALGTCGGGGVSGQCGVPPCKPKKCSDLGDNCGPAADGCGGLLQCGTCSLPNTCGGAGMANTCGIPPTCTNLCLKQQTCANPAVTTTISGTVYAPNGTDPLPNAVVYVPNAPVDAFTAGVTCDKCGTEPSGSPLVSYVTAIDGKFLLQNVPVGSSIPVVIQLGRWRRQVTINTSPCQDNPLAPALTHLPTQQSEGDIPLIAFSTGSVDALECVFRKIGVKDSEFTSPSGTGRIQIYEGIDDPNSQFHQTQGGAVAPGGSPSESGLWGSLAALKKYDMVFFPCQADQTSRTAAQQKNLIDYTTAGGRVFATHFSYIWLYNDAPFNGTSLWDVEQHESVGGSPPDQTGFIDTSFPKGNALAQWLKLVGASSITGEIPLSTIRVDYDFAISPSQSWMTIDDPTGDFADQSVHYTFNTPIGKPASQQCGRVLFDDYHVENVKSTQAHGVTFPNECLLPGFTPQEKLLEFMIFDLGACITSDQPPSCQAKTCDQLGINCGPAGDGCGNVLQCGNCPMGQTCGGGGSPSVCGAPECIGETCGQQGIQCGPAGDGCGNSLQCGSCPMGQSCGGGGKSGVCGTQACSPKTCAQQGIHCGPAGDGCGTALQCGSCASGQTCGGGGQPGVCGAPACTPKSCAQLGYNCGKVNDGCGTLIDCGTCVTPQTCGGSGQANVCGYGSPS